MASSGVAVVAAVARQSARWAATSALLTAAACAALKLLTPSWFHVVNIGACIFWFAVMLHRLFIPVSPPGPAWSPAEALLPLAQLLVRITEEVFTLGPHGPQS